MIPKVVHKWLMERASNGGKSTSHAKQAAARLNLDLANEARNRKAAAASEAIKRATAKKRKANRPFGRQLPGELAGYVDYNKRGAK